MLFTFLGTGCPVPSPVRAGPAHCVSAGDALVLVDCGSGVAQRLVAAGRRGADVDALIVTHYHSDHVADFWTLVVSSWHQGRARPWQVYAPPAAIRHFEAQIAAYADEIALRMTHERRPSTAGLEIAFHELAAGPVAQFGPLAVTAFPVDHRPVAPAYGLVLEADRRRIVFSGDTAPVATLARAAQGADLLVQEVFVDAEMVPVAGVRSAETVAAVRGYHTTPTQAADLARDAGVAAVALTHIVPPAANRLALMQAVRAGFAGPVIIGEDLMGVDVATRTVACRDVVIGY
ncbi:MAG: MBL fold metallo-hydrolase [Alsobacter sp.]